MKLRNLNSAKPVCSMVAERGQIRQKIRVNAGYLRPLLSASLRDTRRKKQLRTEKIVDEEQKYKRKWHNNAEGVLVNV